MPGWQPGHQSFYLSQCLEHSRFLDECFLVLGVEDQWVPLCTASNEKEHTSPREETAETRDRLISTAGWPYHIVQLEHFEGEKRGNARTTGENSIVWEALVRITSQTWPSLPPGNCSLDDRVRSPLGMEETGCSDSHWGDFRARLGGHATQCPVKPSRATERQPTF